MRTYKVEVRLLALQTNPTDQDTLRELAVIETADLFKAENIFEECNRVIKKEII